MTALRSIEDDPGDRAVEARIQRDSDTRALEGLEDARRAALNGWLVIDKPEGLSSNRAVALVHRLTGVKAGHAGTLDPLATGVLPVALGEATKTIAFAMSARKTYRFRVAWGLARATDDREGAVIGESSARPSAAAIAAVLPRFLGAIEQRPPPYCALHIEGRRAYALARAGRPALLPARPVEIKALRLVALPDRDHADFEAVVGKGVYIRALARDLGLALGTLGHVAAMRRLSVGRFAEAQAISLDSLAERRHILCSNGDLLPIETALDDIPALALGAAEAERLRCGQRVIPRDPEEEGRIGGLAEGRLVGAFCDRTLIALARVEKGGLRPVRVIRR
jgi:tRNA pseudouridine55 synthase